MNNGDCEDLINGYGCTCDLGYVGVHCENGKHQLMQVILPVHNVSIMLERKAMTLF